MIDFLRMRYLINKLPDILWDIEQKEANATRITSNITGMPRGGGGLNQSENAKLALIDAKDAYREALKELEEMRHELEQELLKLEDENERAIMRMRYIYGYSPGTIAQTISYHPRSVYRYLKSAERKLSESCQ